MIGGIDIGGTKIGVCVAEMTDARDIRIVADQVERVDPETSPEEELSGAVRRLRSLASEAGRGVESVGVSCPGPFDRKDRKLLSVPNMPRWQGFGLGTWLDAQLGVPVRVMNDANAAALAEYRWGGFGDPEVLVFLTMSTGLGAGIVINGRVFEGRRGFAGEVGRVRLTEGGPVGFGAYGTSEGYASGPGIVQLAEAERLRCAQVGETTVLNDAALDAAAVCEAAGGGDAPALRVLGESAKRLGELIGILSNILEPDVVVLGTIGSAHPGLFIPMALEHARANTHIEMVDRLRIEPSVLDRRWQRQCLAVALREV